MRTSLHLLLTYDIHELCDLAQASFKWFLILIVTGKFAKHPAWCRYFISDLNAFSHYTSEVNFIYPFYFYFIIYLTILRISVLKFREPK